MAMSPRMMSTVRKVSMALPARVSVKNAVRSHHDVHAAEDKPRPRRPDYPAAIAAASSTSTATSLETPGSFMVTPVRWPVISMVSLLWVMTMN